MSRVRSGQRVWRMDDFFDSDVVKNHDFFQKSEKPSWDLRTTRKHIPGHMEKHRSFASEAFMRLV